MDTKTHHAAQMPNAMNKLVMGLAIACIALITPFTVIYFIQGRYQEVAVGCVITAIFSFNIWSIARQDRYFPNVMLFGLMPIIVAFIAHLLRTQGLTGVFWSFPAVCLFYFVLPEKKAWLANAVLLGIVAFYAVALFEPLMAMRSVATIGMVSLFTAIFINVITEQQRKLRAQAFTDPLTGVLNRTSLKDSLDLAIHQNNRSRVPMSLIALDLDHFKSINDSRGHDAGDSVLQNVAGVLMARCRRVDKIFRIGGEEFLALLYDTDIDNCQKVAEELRSQISALGVREKHSVTASIGVSTLRPQERRHDWMKRADDNLYHAKQRGRDQVVA